MGWQCLMYQASCASKQLHRLPAPWALPLRCSSASENAVVCRGITTGTLWTCHISPFSEHAAYAGGGGEVVVACPDFQHHLRTKLPHIVISSAAASPSEIVLGFVLNSLACMPHQTSIRHWTASSSECEIMWTLGRRWS